MTKSNGSYIFILLLFYHGSIFRSSVIFDGGLVININIIVQYSILCV
jgi:hypothetical protein